MGLTKSQLYKLERYHLRVLRKLQSLQQQTASSAIYMLCWEHFLLRLKYIKRQLSLLHAVISSENEGLQSVVQRQLACSSNNESSFFLHGCPGP